MKDSPRSSRPAGQFHASSARLAITLSALLALAGSAFFLAPSHQAASPAPAPLPNPPAAATSTIMYSGIRNIEVPVTVPAYNLDINFDGANDYAFLMTAPTPSTASRSQIQFRGVDDPYLVLSIAPGSLEFSQTGAIRLEEDAVIDSSRVFFRGGQLVRVDNDGRGNQTGVFYSATGWHPGHPQRPSAVEGYLGFKRPCPTNPHSASIYGWVHVRWEDNDSTPGPDKLVIIDWAVQTACDTPIAVGDTGLPTEPGAALDFGAPQDFVQLPSATLPSGSSYTKEAWVYARSTSCDNIVSSNADPLFLFNGRLYAGNGNNYFVLNDPNPFPANQWVHVAVTYDASTTTMRLYRNGSEVAVNTNAPAYAGGVMAIGSHFGGNCRFDGMMDDVRIWGRALCPAEILGRMNSELNGAEDGLRAYYKFNQGVAGGNNAGLTTAIDSGPNGFNGTLMNFALSGATSNWVAPGGVATGSSYPPVPSCDPEGDGVSDSNDNCPSDANNDQANNDGDAEGDACDADDDNDGAADTTDNCPSVANPDQTDTDVDGAGDACDADDDGDGVSDSADNCPLVANASQADTDGDSQGDACDPDDDNDGVSDANDAFPLDQNESV